MEDKNRTCQVEIGSRYVKESKEVSSNNAPKASDIINQIESQNKEGSE